MPEGLGTATAGSGEILKVFTYGFLPAATCHILTRLVAESGIPNLAHDKHDKESTFRWGSDI